MREDELNLNWTSQNREHAKNVISLPFKNERFDSDEEDDTEGVRVTAVRAIDASYFQTYEQ